MGGRKVIKYSYQRGYITHRLKRSQCGNRLPGANQKPNPRKFPGEGEEVPFQVQKRWMWVVQEVSGGGLQQNVQQTQLQKMNPQREVGTRQPGAL